MELAEELRSLMRRMPASVSIVTAEVDGHRYGLTVGSLVSLSLDPPLVGMSISRQSPLNSLLRESDGFAVSTLAGDQDWIAQHFARNVPPLVLWNGIPLREGGGPPQIEGALGWLLCRCAQTVEVGTHTLFVGAVASVEHGRSAPALLYAGGRYLAL